MKYKRISSEVLYTNEGITRIDQFDIESLKALAEKNTRRRIRLCAHTDIQDDLHEMIIVHARDTYVRPHKHIGKSESFHVVEGLLLIVIFNDDGSKIEEIPMGDLHSGYPFYYRLPASLYHTVIPQQDFVVFHEVTKGPFDRLDTVFAPWAPSEDDNLDIQRDFQESIKSQI